MRTQKLDNPERYEHELGLDSNNWSLCSESDKNLKKFFGSSFFCAFFFVPNLDAAVTFSEEAAMQTEKAAMVSS